MIMRDGSFVSEDYVYTKHVLQKKYGAETDLTLCQPYIEKAKQN